MCNTLRRASFAVVFLVLALSTHAVGGFADDVSRAADRQPPLFAGFARCCLQVENRRVSELNLNKPME
jgi:hypothetical protein